MKQKEFFLTSEGYLELETELNYLKTDKRKEVLSSLKEARALGDLSENAEYDNAREEQGKLEARASFKEDKTSFLLSVFK